MLTKEQILERNRKIRENGKATRLKRANQTCKSFIFKIDYNNCNKKQQEAIKMMFVEAKWIYNYLLANDMIYNCDYKDLNFVIHKDKDRNDIKSPINHIKSSIKQELIHQIQIQIKTLSILKQKGHTVGKLKFKSEFNSIKLKQYGITHSIKGNKIKIQGIKDPIRLLGLKQLDKYTNIDFTTANLIYNGINYFIVLTCYIDKEKNIKNNNVCGIDMGVATSITLSNGTKYDIYIVESERLKRLQAQLSRKKKGSNNRYKTIKKIRKEYNHITNIKNDVSNKIVSKILKEHGTIVLQDEQISKWRQDGLSGTKIQHSVLGRIKSKLMQSDNVIILDKWFQTTKYCNKCGNRVELKLSDRIFECPNCKTKEDRDIHAAKNMIWFYFKYKHRLCAANAAHKLDEPGTDCTSKKLVDRKICYNKFKSNFEGKQESAKLQPCGFITKL